MSKFTKKCMAIRTLSDTASGCHTFLCKFWRFQMAVSQWKPAWLTPNLGILWISVSSFWLCESIVANPIIYRLVPRPSRFETRQLFCCCFYLKFFKKNWPELSDLHFEKRVRIFTFLSNFLFFFEFAPCVDELLLFFVHYLLSFVFSREKNINYLWNYWQTFSSRILPPYVCIITENSWMPFFKKEGDDWMKIVH